MVDGVGEGERLGRTGRVKSALLLHSGRMMRFFLADLSEQGFGLRREADPSTASYHSHTADSRDLSNIEPVLTAELSNNYTRTVELKCEMPSGHAK